jgi:hypothetical protein
LAPIHPPSSRLFGPSTSDDDMDLLDDDESPLIKDMSPLPTDMDINMVFTLPTEFRGAEEKVA